MGGMKQFKEHLAAITTIPAADGAAVLERCQREQGGFLKDLDVALLAADDKTRLTLLLVRCGGGRFLAPAQDVAHFIGIIERDADAGKVHGHGGDYVRDVSIPADSKRELLEALKALRHAYRVARPQIAGTDAIEDQAIAAIANAERGL